MSQLLESPTLRRNGRATVPTDLAARPALGWRWLTGYAEWLALAGVLIVAACLDIIWLDREAYGNTYYAAAVKSMLTGWRAFFFASFDSAGFVAVDKPPVGLWVQAASAWLFGFNGLSLLLPQAIAGVLAVGVLYLLLRRAFGTAAGLFGALALATMPISVVTNRNNTMDTQLILVLLVAAGAASLAAEAGRLKPLLLCAALVGLAYNIKMLQAFLVLPAFWLAYLLLAPIRPPKRLLHLTLATLLLMAVSLSWSVVVDLTPASLRPYVGSSGSNSAISLALGYNGLGRVTEALAAHIPLPWLDGVTVDLTSAPGFAPGVGNPSLLRLLGPALAGQASWLLPLAVLGLVAAATQVVRTRRRRLDIDQDMLARRRVALVIWGGWLLPCLGYFSFARFYHIYYLVMIGPAIAALAGIGIAAGWALYRRGGWRRLILPLGLAATALFQAGILVFYPAQRSWLTPLILALALGSALALIMAGPLSRWTSLAPRIATAAAIVGSVALLLAPTAWSAISVRDNNGAAWLPQAGPGNQFGPGGRGGGGPFGGFGPGGAAFGNQGPPGGGRFGGGPGSAPQGPGGPGPGGFGGPGGRPGDGGPMAMTFAGDQWNSLDPGLVQYLLANQGTAEFLVATPTSSYASLFMLATDQPAMALGGYQGWDRILTPDALADLVSRGVVRFFYLSPGGGPPGSGFGPAGSSQDATADLTAWVRASCAPVPASSWQSTSDTRGGSGQQLYDCGALQH